MIDDEIDGDEGVDLVGVCAELVDGLAHGREIHDGGDSGEILEDDTRGHEGNLGGRLARRFFVVVAS